MFRGGGKMFQQLREYLQKLAGFESDARLRRANDRADLNDRRMPGLFYASCFVGLGYLKQRQSKVYFIWTRAVFGLRWGKGAPWLHRHLTYCADVSNLRDSRQ